MKTEPRAYNNATREEFFFFFFFFRSYNMIINYGEYTINYEPDTHRCFVDFGDKVELCIKDIYGINSEMDLYVALPSIDEIRSRVLECKKQLKKEALIKLAKETVPSEINVDSNSLELTLRSLIRYFNNRRELHEEDNISGDNNDTNNSST